MDDIRNALLKGENNKLTKKQYKFAVELEKSRLLQQLVFLTFVSLLISVILFFSLYFDIHNKHKTDDAWAQVSCKTALTSSSQMWTWNRHNSERDLLNK